MNGPQDAPYEPGTKVIVQTEASYRYCYGEESLVMVNGNPVPVKTADVRGVA